MEMERVGNPSIGAFRKLGGPGLLIPTQPNSAGSSPSPVDAARCSACYRLLEHRLWRSSGDDASFYDRHLAGDQSEDRRAQREQLLSVGGPGQPLRRVGLAEGKPGSAFRRSNLSVTRGATGFVLNGSKKPCSLSASMDLLTASTPAPEGMDAGLRGGHHSGRRPRDSSAGGSGKARFSQAPRATK